MKKLIATLTIAAAGLGLYAAPAADATPAQPPTHCVVRAVPQHPHTRVLVCREGRFSWIVLRSWPGTLVFTRTITR